MSNQNEKRCTDIKYWAFISYSSTDKKWGEWLINKLEAYRIPKHLVNQPKSYGAVPQRLYPIFRDRDELRAGANLEEELKNALQQSRFLIVICSPNSADPQSWVNKEICMFKALGRQKEVLSLIVDGEPNASDVPGSEGQECFPVALRYRVDSNGEITEERVEPLAADFRPGHGEGKRKEFLKLVAPIINVNFEDLERRDRKRRNRRRIAATFASAILLSVLIALGLFWFGEKKTSFSAQMAKEAIDKLQTETELALLLSAYSYQIANTPAAYSSLLTAVRDSPHLLTYLHRSTQISALAFSSDGKLLAVAGCDTPGSDSQCIEQTISFYDMHTLDLARENIRFREGTLMDMSFRSGTDELIVATRKNTYVIFDLNQDPPLATTWTMDGNIMSLNASLDGRFRAFGLDSGELKLYDLHAGGRKCVGGESFLERIFGGGDLPIEMITFAPKGNWIAIGNRGGEFAVLEIENCSKHSLSVMDNLGGLAFDHAGSKVFAIMLDGTITEWDLPPPPDRQPSSKFHMTGYMLNGYLHVFSSGATLLASKNDSEIRVFDFARRRELMSLLRSDEVGSLGESLIEKEIERADSIILKGHLGEPMIIRFSPDGRLLASADDRGNVLLWDLEGRALSEQFPASKVSEINSMQPVGQEAIIPELDLTLHLEDESEGCVGDYTQECRRQIKLVLVNLQTKQTVGWVVIDEMRFTSLEDIEIGFTSEGKLIVKIGDELTLWHIDAETLLDLVCQKANRQLTIEELQQRLGWWYRLFVSESRCSSETVDDR